MSRMSSPTPLSKLVRPEDITALNNLLVALCIDERARIKLVDDIILTKAPNSYTASASITFDTSSPVFVIGAVKVGSVWHIMPYVNAVGGSTLVVQETITLSSTNTSSTQTVTATLNCNSTDYAASLIRNIKIIVLKDKME